MSPAGASYLRRANPGTQTAGTAFNVTLTAIDAYGNTATGYTGSQGRRLQRPVELAEQHGADLPGSVTFASGVGTASITLFDAQTTTLTATQGSITRCLGQLHGQPGRRPDLRRGQPGHPDGRHGVHRGHHRHRRLRQHGDGLHRRPAIAFSGPANSPNGHAPTYPASVTFTNGVGTASDHPLRRPDHDADGRPRASWSAARQHHGQRCRHAASLTVPTRAPRAGTAFGVTHHRHRRLRQHGDGLQRQPGHHLQRPGQLAQRPRADLPGHGHLRQRRGHGVITLYDAQSTTLTATEVAAPRGPRQLHGEPGGRRERSPCRRRPPRQPGRRSTRPSPPSTPTATRPRATPGARPSSSAARPTRRTAPRRPTRARSPSPRRGHGVDQALRRPDHDADGHPGRHHRHLGQLHGRSRPGPPAFAGQPGHPDSRHRVLRGRHRHRRLRQHGDGLRQVQAVAFTGPANSPNGTPRPTRPR